MNWISIEKATPATPDNEDLPDYVIEGITHFVVISDFINLNL